MIRESAKYAFGIAFTRFMSLNDDFTIPNPDRIIGGAGPFNFSSAAVPAAVPLITKIDNEDAETVNVDLSGAGDLEAVTVDELVDAINLAAPTDMLASKEAVTGRLMLAYDGTEDPKYIQVYGLCATLAKIGQGFGVKFVKSDTLKSIGDSPTLKDSETITTTDAKGLDTEIITDGYRKGFTATVVDTPDDWELLSLIEGGQYDSTAKKYDPPTSESKKIYFFVEVFYGRYSEGSNKEADLVDYVKKLYRSCSGAVGDKTHERGWADGNYSIVGTTYKDERGDMYADTMLEELSVEQYEALDVYNV